MERNIRPCRSKSGKWKRLSKLKSLAGPYSHSSRRQVQRYRSCPLVDPPFPDAPSDVNADKIIADFHNSQNLSYDTPNPGCSGQIIQHVETNPLTLSCNLECIQAPEVIRQEQRSLSVEELFQDAEVPHEEIFPEPSCFEVLGNQLAIPVKISRLEEKLLSFIARYKLSNIAANSLLRLVKCVNAEDLRRLPRNLTALEKNVLSESPEFLLQWVCSNKDCSRLLHVRTKPDHPNNQSVVCCGITYSTNDSHTLYNQIIPLFRSVLPTIWNYRAPEYMVPRMKDRFAKLGLNPVNDISITLNIDGVPVSKSSNCSLWPILGYVDDLPQKVLSKCILLFGVWVGHPPNTKPDMNKLLKPIIYALNTLSEEAITWNLDSKTEMKTKVVVSKILCDSMARPAVQKLQQLNGKFGCGYCLHEETNHYFMHVPLAEERSNAIHRKICATNDFSRSNVALTQGVTGKSMMLELPYLDIINDFPPCFLHTIYLGVSRTFTQLLLTDAICPGKLGKDALQCLTDNLLLIKPPHRVSRSPRSFSEMAHWKGHEWGMWLLYYSPILLYKALTKQYWYHWIHLVYGCSMLLRSSRGIEQEIIDERISSASASFEVFSRDVSKLYGASACRFNVHLLRHLPKLAALWGGNLLNTTMAPFETYNGVLQGFINNSQHMSYQIGRRYWRSVKTLEVASTQRANTLMGHLSDYEPPEGIVVPSESGNVVYYSHVRTSANKTLYSDEYKRSKLRYSAWVKLNTSKIGQVMAFAKTDDRVYAIIKMLTYVPFATLDHIFKITGSTGHEIIDTDDIVDILLRVDSGIEKFACEFLNNVEHIRE